MPKKHLKPMFEEIDSGQDEIDSEQDESYGEQDESCRQLIIHKGLRQKESVFAKLDLKPILERHKEELRRLTSTYKMENDFLKRENRELNAEIGRLRGINVDTRQKDDATIKNLRKLIDFGSDKLLRDKDRLIGQLRQELSNAKRHNETEVRALNNEIRLYKNQLLSFKDQSHDAQSESLIQKLKGQVSKRDVCIRNLKAEVSSKRQNLEEVSKSGHFQNFKSRVPKDESIRELAKFAALFDQEVEKFQTTVDSYENEALALRKRNGVVERELASKTKSLKELKRNGDRIVNRLRTAKNQLIKKQSQKTYCHKRVAFVGQATPLPKNLNRTIPVYEKKIEEKTLQIQNLTEKLLKLRKEREKDHKRVDAIKDELKKVRDTLAISQAAALGTSSVPAVETTDSKARRKNRKFPELEIIKGKTAATARLLRPFSIGAESREEKTSFCKLQKRKNI